MDAGIGLLDEGVGDHSEDARLVLRDDTVDFTGLWVDGRREFLLIKYFSS